MLISLKYILALRTNSVENKCKSFNTNSSEKDKIVPHEALVEGHQF